MRCYPTAAFSVLRRCAPPHCSWHILESPGLSAGRQACWASAIALGCTQALPPLAFPAAARGDRPLKQTAAPHTASAADATPLRWSWQPCCGERASDRPLEPAVPAGLSGRLQCALTESGGWLLFAQFSLSRLSLLPLAPRATNPGGPYVAGIAENWRATNPRTGSAHLASASGRPTQRTGGIGPENRALA